MSADAESLYASLGVWADNDGETTGWHLLHFCEALVGASQLQDIDDVVRDTDTGSGWSSVVDLNRTPDSYLDWLAQFVGVVIAPGSTAAAKRTLMATRPAQLRGRPEVITAAVTAVLTGTQRVTLTERDTSAYHFDVKTWHTQTPSPAAVVAAVTAVKPAGLQFTHTIIVSPSYATIEGAVGAGRTYADRKARFPTYQDVLNYVP